MTTADPLLLKWRSACVRHKNPSPFRTKAMASSSRPVTLVPGRSEACTCRPAYSHKLSLDPSKYSSCQQTSLTGKSTAMYSQPDGPVSHTYGNLNLNFQIWEAGRSGNHITSSNIGRGHDCTVVFNPWPWSCGGRRGCIPFGTPSQLGFRRL